MRVRRRPVACHSAGTCPHKNKLLHEKGDHNCTRIIEAMQACKGPRRTAVFKPALRQPGLQCCSRYVFALLSLESSEVSEETEKPKNRKLGGREKQEARIRGSEQKHAMSKHGCRLGACTADDTKQKTAFGMQTQNAASFLHLPPFRAAVRQPL